MRSLVLFVLVLAACNKKPEEARPAASPASDDAGEESLGFGGGSIANGTADRDAGAGTRNTGQDPATMSAGSVGHTFAQ